MLIFLGASASAPLGITTMPGFINFLDKTIGKYQIYNDIKSSFGRDLDLEILMAELEDLSKPQDEFIDSISI